MEFDQPKRSRRPSAFVLILPYMEGQDWYDLGHLDEADSDGNYYSIWSTAAFSQWLAPSTRYGNDRARLLTDVRPPMYVCPSDQSEPRMKTPNAFGFPNGVSPTVGSYALCSGSLGPSPNEATSAVKCGNTGMFVYKIPRKIKQLTDGSSKTFTVGEVIGADEDATRNVWSTAVRVSDSMRTTQSGLNQPKNLWFTSPTYGSKFSGGFGSYHPGGGNFLYVDGHVSFISDGVAQDAYDATATYKSAEGVEAIQ